MEHPSNIAVALDVCKQVGVNRSTALKGMHKVQPDAGALVAWNLDIITKMFGLLMVWLQMTCFNSSNLEFHF